MFLCRDGIQGAAPARNGVNLCFKVVGDICCPTGLCKRGNTQDTPSNQIIFCTEYSNEANFNEPHSFARNRGDISNESLICQETARYINFLFSFSRIKSKFTGPLRGSRLLHCSELGNLNKLFEGGGRLALEREREGREKGLGGSFCTKLYFCWKG